MHFSTIVAAAALAGSAVAKDILVVVGNGTLTFEPDNIDADEGDNVIFKFWPKNHSVAQGSFGSPCTPLDDGGFWSGYVPSTQGANETTFHYTVENASAPIWFYCTQGQHCQGGMVGVINGPSSGNTLQRYKDASADADANVAPNSVAGEGGMLMKGSTTSPSGSASGTGAAATGSASPTGAASTLEVSNFAFTGVLGMFAYLMM